MHHGKEPYERTEAEQDNSKNCIHEGVHLIVDKLVTESSLSIHRREVRSFRGRHLRILNWLSEDALSMYPGRCNDAGSLSFSR